MTAESALHRWHPIEGRRESRAVPVPQAGDEFRAGQQRLRDDETAGSLATEPPPDAVVVTGLAGVGWPFMPC